MPNLDKDIYQKQLAIRFCLVNGLTPFLEVNIQNFRELSTTSTIITDIDVLGVKIDSAGRPKRVIFDCKTLGKTSPINRAFWAGGLMNFASCDEAFIILRKKASEAHRLSAKQIKVHLFDETQFNNYGESCSVDFKIDYCYSSNIDSWMSLYAASSGNPSLEQLSGFLHNEVPIEKDAVKALRKFLAAISKEKGEFDPAKPKHQALFYYSVSIFAFLLAQIVHDLRNIVDFDAGEKQFETILKYYIWGGRDSFLIRQKMAELFANSREGTPNQEPELKEWSSFMLLVRKLLDSPEDIQKCIFPLREFSFMCLTENNIQKTKYTADHIDNNNRIRQFSISMAKYLTDSLKLPRDFHLALENKFNELRFK
ncbi:MULTISPECIES: hypothetical protein [Pseudomonas]|uniref:hypothetical protein n=1 Tax=Pseudomonas TaxID=286 RepID=UPI0003BAC781|nr:MULTISPECIES: hypothetical protein [Pseudomonas]ERX43704.1 hypothetical protein Q006_04991 [Pseudomonas aeruginosa UDL]MBG4892402.1 hypothetical protein [Pseudomonas aeruginosa]MBG6305984.1 hypothetical protein [Pseudomonas aeruginosa]MBH4056963.1 hypothetical protein [Pseudomonas aeruginosa]MBI8596801.1 hypothetical protein [Pseudomonas aeruginosa]